jgi:hypothetical protein
MEPKYIEIHKCPDEKCGHQSGDHGHPAADGQPTFKGGNCSMGGCHCRLTPQQVKAADIVKQIRVWPAGVNPFAKDNT